MRQLITGTVVGISGLKTIKVTASRRRIHPIYKKRYTITKSYLVHDADQTARVGDKVLLTSSLPISKRKRWQLQEIIERARLPKEPQ